jgi:hypothetical protein
MSLGNSGWGTLLGWAFWIIIVVVSCDLIDLKYGKYKISGKSEQLIYSIKYSQFFALKDNKKLSNTVKLFNFYFAFFSRAFYSFDTQFKGKHIENNNAYNSSNNYDLIYSGSNCHNWFCKFKLKRHDDHFYNNKNKLYFCNFSDDGYSDGNLYY